MKREREDDDGDGAAVPPSHPSVPAAAASARVFGRAMVPPPSGFPGLRAPSPIVRAMRTRLDPSPPPLPPPPPPLPPLLPQILPERRRRGRPRSCDRLPPPPGFHLSPPAPTRAAPGKSQSGGLQLHVLDLDVGDDIVSRILDVSVINGKAICVLSVLGVVQEADILLSSGVKKSHKGPLEIFRVSGSILTSGSSQSGRLSVTLASSDYSVIAGVIAGPLIAAAPVQAIVGSFHSDAFSSNKACKMIPCYPNSHAAIRNKVTCYPGSQVSIGTGSKHFPYFQVSMGNGSTHCPDSQVPLGNGSMPCPNYRVPITGGSTHDSIYRVSIGDGSTCHPSAAVTIGTGSTSYPKSIGIGDGSTNQHICHVAVDNGSIDNVNSQVSAVNGGTRQPKPEIGIGSGNTNSDVTTCDRSTNSSSVTVGDGSARNPSSEVGMGSEVSVVKFEIASADGNTYCDVTVGDGSAHNPSSEVKISEGGSC